MLSHVLDVFFVSSFLIHAARNEVYTNVCSVTHISLCCDTPTSYAFVAAFHLSTSSPFHLIVLFSFFISVFSCALLVCFHRAHFSHNSVFITIAHPLAFASSYSSDMPCRIHLSSFIHGYFIFHFITHTFFHNVDTVCV